MKSTYNPQTEEMLQSLKQNGHNLWPMLHIFKRRSKLAVEIPDEVIQAVCVEYTKRGSLVRSGFPYFLTVLKRKSEEYFAKQNVTEGEKIKKEPLAMKDIMKQILEAK